MKDSFSVPRCRKSARRIANELEGWIIVRVYVGSFDPSYPPNIEKLSANTVHIKWNPPVIRYPGCNACLHAWPRGRFGSPENVFDEHAIMDELLETGETKKKSFRVFLGFVLFLFHRGVMCLSASKRMWMSRLINQTCRGIQRSIGSEKLPFPTLDWPERGQRICWGHHHV